MGPIQTTTDTAFDTTKCVLIDPAHVPSSSLSSIILSAMPLRWHNAVNKTLAIGIEFVDDFPKNPSPKNPSGKLKDRFFVTIL